MQRSKTAIEGMLANKVRQLIVERDNVREHIQVLEGEAREAGKVGENSKAQYLDDRIEDLEKWLYSQTEKRIEEMRRIVL